VVTALRAPAIATLAAADGPLQMSLFDNQDLAQIAHPDYPGERLIACHNPALAAERARKRSELLAATDTLLAGIAGRAAGGTLTGAGEIGTAVGRRVHEHLVSSRGLGADRLVHLRVRGGLSGRQRRHLIGRRRHHPRRWGRRSRILSAHRRADPLQGADRRGQRHRLRVHERHALSSSGIWTDPQPLR
jgi:hypothetical protein